MGQREKEGEPVSNVHSIAATPSTVIYDLPPPSRSERQGTPHNNVNSSLKLRSTGPHNPSAPCPMSDIYLRP